MKIAVVSFYYYNHQYWCNHDILEEYCNTHGYHLHYHIQKVDDENIHTPTYDGIVYMRELLTKDYDWVFWIDGTDIIITNPTMKLEDMVGDKPIQFSNDVITSNPVEIWECNTGFWAVNNSDICRTFLDDVIESYDKEMTNRWSEDFYHDQDAINVIARNSYMNHIDTNVLKQKYWFYSTPRFYGKDVADLITYLSNQGKNPNVFKIGDFMIHFAGRVLHPDDMEYIYKKIKDEVVDTKS